MSEVILAKQHIRRLLAAGNGDSALLYLCRAAGLSDVATGFTEARLESAATLLRQLGLDDSQNPRFQQPAEPPAYTEEDVRLQMELPRSGFRKLVGEVQRCLGRVLSTEDLKILLSLAEYVGLPYEVITILVHYCVEAARSRGLGRMPSLRAIEKTAYRWADDGIDSMDRAAAYLQAQRLRMDRQAQIVQMLGIEGRRLTVAEEDYLKGWIEAGFSNEVVHLAYEKTCGNVGTLNWRYMNGILESWRAQGLYTVEAIRLSDRKPGAASPGYQRHGDALSPQMQAAVQRMLAQQEDT